jgi:predicted AAA+ superfamily ATPase
MLGIFMDKDVKNDLSIGVSEFEQLIQKNMTYVDKTHFIKKMLDHGKTYYFLSRPRRFGKTLFLSTLESFFKGKNRVHRGAKNRIKNS